MTRNAFLFGLILLLVPNAHSQQNIEIAAIENSASHEPGFPSGGGLATAFFRRLTRLPGLPGNPGTVTSPASAPSLELDGIKVFINGAPAPLFAVFIPGPDDPAPARIDFQVPLERNSTLVTLGGVWAPINGMDRGGTLELERLGARIAFFSPLPHGGRAGFFSADGYALAQHASDNASVTPDNPARPGEEIIVYGTDLFLVWPPAPIGFPAPEEPIFRFRAPLVFEHLYLQEYPRPISRVPGFGIEGSYATTPAVKITFRGLAPNQIGVQQINFIVPVDQKPGDWALFFNRGTCPETGRICIPGGISSSYVKLLVR